MPAIPVCLTLILLKTSKYFPSFLLIFLLVISLSLSLAMANQKVVILTGASRGIGLAIAKKLLKDGHKLMLVARTAEPLEKLKAEYVGAVEVFTGDLKDMEVSIERPLNLPKDSVPHHDRPDRPDVSRLVPKSWTSHSNHSLESTV